MNLVKTADSKLVSYLLSPDAIRQRAAAIYAHTKQDRGHFLIDENRIEELADYVILVMRQNHPDLNIPYHSRWRHFDLEGSQVLSQYNARTQEMGRLEKACTGIDLIVPSVLLDAGAGSKWKFTDAETTLKFGRSEGLGLASIQLFMCGALSHDKRRPLTTHADKLVALSDQEIIHYFQVSDRNPLVGVQGRANLLKSLGLALKNNPAVFPNGRPGDLVLYLSEQFGDSIEAQDILKLVLHCFNQIWPGRSCLHGVQLGDVWQYPPLGEGHEALIPFHKLSQWLTYSIIETLQVNGFEVLNLNRLTGLAEYRNGGLFVDGKVLSLKDKNMTDQSHAPSSELIIEWRALTIHLLDKIADMIRTKLHLSDQQLPLVKILEGGTWLAGRKLASKYRLDGSPPIQLQSDGTVF